MYEFNLDIKIIIIMVTTYKQFCSELHDSESLIIMSCYRVYANIDKI